MASIEEKVNCVLWLAELKSTVAVQRKFRIEYNKEPPHRNTIAKWMKKFKETGSVHDKPRSGRPCVSDVFRELENRITLCISNDGGHVET